MQSGWQYTAQETSGDWELNNTNEVTPVPAVNPSISYNPNGMALKVEGPQYAGFCASKPTPILPLKSGILTASMEVFCSPEALLMNAWEFDHRLTDANGNILPLDMNYVLARGGLIQAVTANGSGWIDSNVSFAPQQEWIGQWIKIAKTGAFDWTKGTCSLLTVSVGPVDPQSVDSSLGIKAPLSEKWGANLCVPQVQPSILGSPALFTVRNVAASAVGTL